MADETTERVQGKSPATSHGLPFNFTDHLVFIANNDIVVAGATVTKRNWTVIADR